MAELAPSQTPVAVGDVVAGKYRVERVVGSGGMGVVFAATHLELDQPVALKFILPRALQGKGNVERFMREARAAVRLKSEHAARVYDVGRGPGDCPFMVLELLDGMDLAKVNKERGPLPVADAVEYVLQACEALVEAHALGIVHRDLKPQNLFLTRRLNGTPLVKVLDFGIAKAIGPDAVGQMSLTDSAAIIGSPHYMAPEQMRSARTAEARSDIWSLGVILYELLAGQIPFDGETITEVCIRVVNEEPPDLLYLRPGLNPVLADIVMRCLEKEPRDRLHNIAAMGAALDPFSRSAKQVGLVRAWRSFSDTQDPRAHFSALTGAAEGWPLAPPTANTVDDSPEARNRAWAEQGQSPERDADDLAEALASQSVARPAVRGLRMGGAAGAACGAGAGARQGSPPAAPESPASTGVTWGHPSARREGTKRFALRPLLAVGAVVAVGTSGAVFSSTRTPAMMSARENEARASTPAAVHSGVAHSASSATTTPLAASRSGVLPAPMPPVTAESRSRDEGQAVVSPVRRAPSGFPVPGRAQMSPEAKGPALLEKVQVPPATSAAAPPPADRMSPNGAPILR